MDMQTRTDLIRRVQLSLRKEAGLSSYDPTDSTLSPLPSFRESVAGFDPSPQYLRCKHCQGRLLRGLQSLICVYCGKRQSKDVTPDPIAFKSTVGYQWLLQSLDLDGSEIVGPFIEENERNRGRRASNEQITLSDLLSLEISWPAESEITGHSLANSVPVQTQSSLNLSGIDLDNFFTESKGDLVSHSMEEQTATNNRSDNVELNAFSSKENVSLFQNVHHSSTLVSSSETNDDDGFSVWEADFQSADSGNQHEVSRSFDAFAGSAVDLTAHMDSVFGSGKDLKDEKSKHASTLLESTSNEQIQDDLWNNVNILAPHQGAENVTIKRKGVVAADNLYTHPSACIDLLPDDKWKTSSTTASQNKTIREDDVLFDIWNDFTSSTTAQDPSKNSLIQTSEQIASVGDQISDVTLASSTNFQDMDFGFLSQPDPFSGSVRDQKISPITAQDSSKNSLMPSSDQISSVGEQVSDVIFSSSTKSFQGMDFGFLSQPDLFSGPFNAQSGSVETNIRQSEVPASDRLADVKVEGGGNVVQDANDGRAINTAIEYDPEIESLLSQMHDLSFMLKSDLSLPSNQMWLERS